MVVARDAWRDWDQPAKQELKLRLAEANAKAGTPVPWVLPTPGDLALRYDPRQVQRSYLELMDQAFADIRHGRIDRVLITTPPQVGKTVRTVWALFWWLTHHPRDRLILASYGAQLAANRGRMVRTLVRDYGAEFGLRIDPEQSASNDWALTCGGGMKTGGMDSGITGNPADVVVIDDPHKNRADADSPLMRERVWETYSSSVLSRMAPNAPLILVQTRWHVDDLAGRVLKEEGSELDGGRWRLLHIPAIATSPDDPLGRHPGEPLPHPRIEEGDTARAAEHWADKKATSSVRDWAALYQGDPQPTEGALLTEEICKAQQYLRDLPDKVKVAVAIDPSGGGRDEAGVVAGFLGADKRLYWTHDSSGVMSSDEWSRVACLLAYEIEADLIIAEVNFGADMVKLAIRTAWDALQRDGDIPRDVLPPRIKLVRSKRGKFLRAEPIAQQVIEDRARFGARLTDFVKEWTTWQPTSLWSPGRLDAGVHLAFGLLKVPGAEVVVSTVSDKPKAPTGLSRTARRQIAR